MTRISRSAVPPLPAPISRSLASSASAVTAAVPLGAGDAGVLSVCVFNVVLPVESHTADPYDADRASG
ncbi:hypothetical protein GCM10010327_40180 [Streptomyces nitrosporeus]|nr:hypothetical protein GCM10010327_40180 [Streptomyces nitrosporeus]